MLDETTYYFTAFALDQNNNIIDSKTGSVTTDFGWKPDSSRTMIYLQLENDFVDRSGNTRTITTSWLSYTTVWWVPSLHLWSSWWWILTSPYPLQSDPTKPITISVLIYVTSAQISSRRNIIEFACTNWNRIFFCIRENTSNIELSSSQWETVYATLHAPVIANSWMHIVVTWTTNSTKLYVNWELKESWNWNPKPRWNRPYGWDNKQAFFSRRDWDYANSLQWNARELIMEQIEWDENFIRSYYNSIKHKLWF